MRALYWNGVNDLRVGTVKDPEPATEPAANAAQRSLANTFSKCS